MPKTYLLVSDVSSFPLISSLSGDVVGSLERDELESFVRNMRLCMHLSEYGEGDRSSSPDEIGTTRLSGMADVSTAVCSTVSDNSEIELVRDALAYKTRH